MVICNIVHDGTDVDGLKPYTSCPAINITTDITTLHTDAPTLFYGWHCARTHLGDKVKIGQRKINESYYWSYHNEIGFENWIEDFVKDCGSKWFKFIENGIDVVFEKFNIIEFADHLNFFPVIHEGNYEIYFGDWRDGDIIIHSVKKDTLKYIGVNIEDFLRVIYERLDYNFLSFEPKRYNLTSKNKPVFLDNLLLANVDNWMGVDEIIKHFNGSNVEIDRKKIIVYYLRQTEFLREKFKMYI